jgi:hypothetical protein
MRHKVMIAVALVFLSSATIGVFYIGSIEKSFATSHSERAQYLFNLEKDVKSHKNIGIVKSYRKSKKNYSTFIQLNDSSAIAMSTSLDHITQGTVVSLAPSTNEKYPDAYCLTRNEKTVCGWLDEIKSI